jgi:hypothetical protein
VQGFKGLTDKICAALTNEMIVPWKKLRLLRQDLEQKCQTASDAVDAGVLAAAATSGGSSGSGGGGGDAGSASGDGSGTMEMSEPLRVRVPGAATKTSAPP